jgi:hypothetical protein
MEHLVNWEEQNVSFSTDIQNSNMLMLGVAASSSRKMNSDL